MGMPDNVTFKKGGGAKTAAAGSGLFAEAGERGESFRPDVL
jgi:hypothetical protein